LWLILIYSGKPPEEKTETQTKTAARGIVRSTRRQTLIKYQTLIRRI
jgi:hypothetical protein